MRDKAITWLGVLMLGLLSPAADLCGIVLPKWLRFGLFLAFVVSLIFVFLAIGISYLPEQRWAKKLSSRQSTVLVIIAGAIIGAIMAPLVWNGLRPDEIDLAQTLATDDVPATAPASTAQQAAIPEGPLQDTAESNDLEFYFNSFFFGGSSQHVQYAGLTVTNRSPRKMHIKLRGRINYWKDNGEPASLEMPAEWTTEIALVQSISGDYRSLEGKTGEDSIDFDPWQTKEGSVFLFLPKPESHSIKQWHVDPSRDVYFHFFDSVTGKHIAFKAVSGYPADKVPWPFPGPKEMLAMGFPMAQAVDQNATATEVLGLLLRTQSHVFSNDKDVIVPAMITNNSATRMKLLFNLLSRDSPDGKVWRTFRATIEPNQKEDRGPLDFYALDFGPGDVAECRLVFSNTGFDNHGEKVLDASPSRTLLEVVDQVSGKKIWCALNPGYPPGTDMRTFDIQSPPPIPSPISDNTTQDAPKDTK